MPEHCLDNIINQEQLPIGSMGERTVSCYANTAQRNCSTGCVFFHVLWTEKTTWKIKAYALGTQRLHMWIRGLCNVDTTKLMLFNPGAQEWPVLFRVVGRAGCSPQGGTGWTMASWGHQAVWLTVIQAPQGTAVSCCGLQVRREEAFLLEEKLSFKDRNERKWEAVPLCHLSLYWTLSNFVANVLNWVYSWNAEGFRGLCLSSSSC